jgi:hypothetical protein
MKATEETERDVGRLGALPRLALPCHAAMSPAEADQAPGVGDLVHSAIQRLLAATMEATIRGAEKRTPGSSIWR